MSTDEDRAAIPTTTGAFTNLFAGLRGRGIDESLDIPTAVMIPIVAAMLADGRVDDQELLQIASACSSSPIFDRNSSAENDFLVARAMKLIEDHGLGGACARARQFLSPALRETAFAQAVRVIFSDGHVGMLEREVVEEMINWLEIDRDRARMMVEVVSVLQHPPTA